MLIFILLIIYVLYIFSGGFDFVEDTIVNTTIHYTDDQVDYIINNINFETYNTFVQTIQNSTYHHYLTNDETHNKEMYWQLQIEINKYLEHKNLPPKYDIINKIIK